MSEQTTTLVVCAVWDGQIARALGSYAELIDKKIATYIKKRLLPFVEEGENWNATYTVSQKQERELVIDVIGRCRVANMEIREAFSCVLAYDV